MIPHNSNCMSSDKTQISQLIIQLYRILSWDTRKPFMLMDISIFQPTQLIFHLHLDRVHVGFGCVQPVDSFPRSYNFFGQDFTGLFFALFGSIFKRSLHFLFFSLNPYKFTFLHKHDIT